MCGIIGLFNNSLNAKNGLEVLKNRGSNDSDSVKVENGELGHCLHAVVGHVRQPLKETGVLTANKLPIGESRRLTHQAPQYALHSLKEHITYA